MNELSSLIVSRHPIEDIYYIHRWISSIYL